VHSPCDEKEPQRRSALRMRWPAAMASRAQLCLVQTLRPSVGSE
jgi:hypothetical protein